MGPQPFKAFLTNASDAEFRVGLSSGLLPGMNEGGFSLPLTFTLRSYGRDSEGILVIQVGLCFSSLI